MPITANKETKHFQTEVKQLLHLMVHALYSNKEIFLRELISNASDACDKLRFLAIDNDALYEGDHTLKMNVRFNEAAGTVSVIDNGIGMSRDEVIQNLGTIAKSGTKNFLQQLTGDKQKDSQLIGQFGVGFYASFIVADKVTVFTRKAGDAPEAGVKWVSEGTGDYDIETVERAHHGTEIILHLKEDEKEFLNDQRLRHIIKTYSDHIGFPIFMPKVALPAADAKDALEAEDASETKEPKIELPEEALKPEEEAVNQATALWTLPKSEIKEAEYYDFYKYLSHDIDEPLAYAHNKVEGKHEYTTLLYIPKRAPFDLFQANKPRGLKLYVQRVFIMDDAEQFLPTYLRFVRGVIDTNDLPLNISREILQNHRLVDTIRSAIVKRVLSLLEGLAKNDAEKYQTFWTEFGQVLKEGPAEDYANREQIAKLLRFASSKEESQAQTVSLEAYVGRMQETQKKIYYIAADSYHAAKHSPHLEVFKEHDIEVLLLHDRIDEWLMSHFTEFDGKALQSVARGSLDMDELGDKAEIEQKQKEAQSDFDAVIKDVKEALTERVEDVRITMRLTDSPSCIVVQDHAMTSQMERLLKSAGQAVPTTKPILELNPDHPLVGRLKTLADTDRFNDLSAVLLDQAILSEGGQLDDPASFVKRFNQLLLELAQ